MNLKANRLFHLDVLRAAAIMYIVGIRHLDDYASGIFHSKLDDVLTYSFRGLFMFLSGYLLSDNNVISSANNIIQFFKKRFIRIYPLYVLSLILFYIGDIISFKTAMYGSLLANTILSIKIPTLWFVSVLCVYYLFFPLLVYKYSLSRIIRRTLCILIVLSFIKYIFDIIDVRLIVFIPLFVSGIVFSKEMFTEKVVNNLKIVFTAFVLLLFFSFLFFVSENIYIRYFFIVLFSSCSLPIFLFISTKYEHIFPKKIINVVSYSSFCMYLFHRTVYGHFVTFCKFDSDIATVIYLYITAVPFLFFLSFIVQKVYDSLINKVLSEGR